MYNDFPLELDAFPLPGSTEPVPPPPPNAWPIYEQRRLQARYLRNMDNDYTEFAQMIHKKEVPEVERSLSSDKASVYVFIGVLSWPVSCPHARRELCL